MTTEQIKNTEMTSQDIVSRNMDVYAKESSLAMAKDIQGLRAIFEEVGTDLLKNAGFMNLIQNLVNGLNPEVLVVHIVLS